MPRRRKDRVDQNQQDIVNDLRKIPGITVEVNHDDILVGCHDHLGIPRTWWFEIKKTEAQSSKTGEILESQKTDSQKKLDIKWTGQRDYVTTVEEILIIMGLK